MKLIVRTGLPSAVTLVLFIGSYWFLMKPAIEYQMIEARKNMTRELVNSAWNIVKSYGEQVESGSISLEDAQNQAKQQLRSMRYGPEGKDYFWINDLTPIMVMHPYRIELESEVVGDFKDPTGKYLFMEFVYIAQTTGEGFSEYYWQWKDDPNRVGKKLSYVKLYKPWGWIIGTGMYIEDVRSRIHGITRQLTLTFAVITGILVLLSGYIVIQGGRAEVIARDARILLQDNESKFRAIFNSAFQFLALASSTGSILEVNDQFLSLSKRSSRDVIGQELWDSGIWAASSRERDRLKEAVRHCGLGQFVRFDSLTETRSGARVYIDLSLKPLFNEKGIVHRILLEGRDITKLKTAERESEFLRNFMKNTIDMMPSLVIAINRDCRITLWNRQCTIHTNIEEETAHGQELVTLIPSMAAYIDRIRDVFFTGASFYLPRQKEKLFEETRVYDLLVFPLIDPLNPTVVIRIDDVTDRVRIEEMMIQSEKMVSVGRLAAGMAHEINNPLAGILQNTQVLRNRLLRALQKNLETAEQTGLDFETLQVYLQQRGIPSMIDAIMKSGQRASTIVSNMLSFSRKSDSDFQEHNVIDLLDQSLELARNDYDLKKKYDFRNIRIVRRYPDAPPIVPCDANQIQQVFLNIFKNGAQAMYNHAGGMPTFTLSVYREDEMMIIEMGDNGPGIPEAVKNQIFEPFFTTKGVGIGTGLGLSVSYFIITENHQGHLSVESTVGRGTVFRIAIPVHRRKNDETA